MGATSVTGTGMGASGGKQKPKNHITCSCGPACQDPVEPTVKKTRCKIVHKHGNRAIIRVGGGSIRTIVCT